MSNYDDSERVVCPECKGDAEAVYTLFYPDDYGREVPSHERQECGLCGGDRVVDKVTTYRRLD